MIVMFACLLACEPAGQVVRLLYPCSLLVCLFFCLSVCLSVLCLPVCLRLCLPVIFLLFCLLVSSCSCQAPADIHAPFFNSSDETGAKGSTTLPRTRYNQKNKK